MSGAPLTDSRRAKALRAALAQMAPWLTPEWAGLEQEGDFGRALYEIAARLAEHSTRRLDQTALRDKLAFLATLDIPAPAPRPAIVPIIFMLAEKRGTPVHAPERVQIATAGDGEPVIFETREAIAITPARPLRLIAADPGADRIELAPPNVIAAPQPSPPPVIYRLVSAAEPGRTMLQLAQAVGLAAGDLLRIDGTVYRIAGRAGEIVTLLDPLEARAPADTALEKVARLDSFALRNLSEHLAYIGHKELLKLDGHATIALRLDPPGLARRLGQLDVAYELWGKPKASDAPGWQPLRLLGGPGGDLLLRKDWPGEVEEVEVQGRKSRWIRLRLLKPLTDADAPDTRAASVSMKVNSNASAAPQADEVTHSIVSAFHNGVPLPLTTAFLPFGPEPQRFDAFAIAAPEALSKKKAAVELQVALSDASLGSLSATTGAPDRLYGVGRNGRLQAVRLEPPGTLHWRQLDRPPPAPTGSGAPPRLDPDGPCLALQAQSGSPAADIAVVRDSAKTIWVAAVRSEGQDWTVDSWTPLPPPGGHPPDSFCLAHTSAEGDATVAPGSGSLFGGTVPAMLQAAPPARSAKLVAANAAGLHVQALESAGAAAQAWLPLALAPGSDPAPPSPLLLVTIAGANHLIAAVDSNGAVHRGQIAGGTVKWSRLSANGTARSSVRPAAVMHENRLHVIVATTQTGRPVAMLREGGGPLYAPPAGSARIGAPGSIACLPADAARPDFPLIVVVGETEAMLWSDEDLAVPVTLPSGGDPKKEIRPALAAGESGADVQLVLGTPGERLLHAPIQGGRHTLAFVAFDLLRADPGTSPEYHLVEGQLAPGAVVPPPLDFPSGRLLPLTPGLLAVGNRYWLLSPLAGGSGTATMVSGQPRQLLLDAADTATGKRHFLKAGDDNTFYAVESVKVVSGRRIATLATDVPTSPIRYTSYRKGKRRRFEREDQKTLLSFEAALPGGVTDLRFAGKPRSQNFTRPDVQPAGKNWVRVGSAWSTPPTDGQATFVVRSSLGAWTQVPLPRSAENPELSWEYFDGRGWRRLDKGFSDGTANLASSGSVRFIVPDDLSPTDVAGQQDYWIRARLVGGDYGRPAYVVQTDPPNRQSITVDRSKLNPPEIFSIEARYALRDYAPPQLVLTVNNLAAVDQTQAAAAAGAEFDLFEGLAAHTGDRPGLGRAIYLGLSRVPGVDSLTLYVDATDVGAPPLRLQAEVLRPEGWTAVVSDDGTAGLTRPGLLRLFLSTAPAELPLFGCAAWWLRLRPVEPRTDWAPNVRGLYLNAVTAEQGKSLRQEILGSSLGAPDQSYTLAEAPVLSETLELRVRESLSDEEKEALTAAAADAVASYPDVGGEWIRWNATDSFAGGGARVFRLDPSSGEIRFGNGREGRIPPAGRDSIRAVGYQAGGGSRGNVPAFAVSQLKTSLESVELAVNPVDAGAGADAPPKERLAATAPARLRHANRALTPPDIEALATSSSPDVVRALCLRTRGCAIDLVVAIRQAGQRCPVPSRARREGIARNIAASAWGALEPRAIRVRPPSYVRIRVEAIVIARTAEGVAEVEHDVRQAIIGFLHPMDGGPGGLGWPFGRRPWPSDVQRIAAAVSGVDRVADVAIAACDAGIDLDRLDPAALVCAEGEDIALVVQPPRGAR
ncbi:MAG TPA: hypothetical protein VD846_06065 [Allosphingosinicella sp.]|nr:hypothetical protein [Allosphingosinicella sp.]